MFILFYTLVWITVVVLKSVLNVFSGVGGHTQLALTDKISLHERRVRVFN